MSRIILDEFRPPALPPGERRDPINALHALRAFPSSQQLLGGSVGTEEFAVTVGWYDSGLHPAQGAFMLVREGSFEDLIGETVALYATGVDSAVPVFVYVWGTGDILEEVAVARRPFMALTGAAAETIDCVMRVRQ